MTDFERVSPEITATPKAVVRLAFTPSEALAGAIRGFSRQDNAPATLYSSRMRQFRYLGVNYPPEDRRELNDIERRVEAISRHQIRLGSYVFLRELENNGLGIDLRLAPKPDELAQLGEFARDIDGQPANYVDVHAIIPPAQRVPSTGSELRRATIALRELVATPYHRVYTHGITVVSRNPDRRVVH